MDLYALKHKAWLGIRGPGKVYCVSTHGSDIS